MHRKVVVHFALLRRSGFLLEHIQRCSIKHCCVHVDVDELPNHIVPCDVTPSAGFQPSLREIYLLKTWRTYSK